jgi:hypothetical protein
MASRMSSSLDIVAVKDGTRVMSGNLFGYRLVNACSDHIANGCSSEVVKEESRYADFFAGVPPGIPKGSHRLPMTMNHQGAVQTAG